MLLLSFVVNMLLRKAKLSVHLLDSLFNSIVSQFHNLYPLGMLCNIIAHIYCEKKTYYLMLNTVIVVYPLTQLIAGTCSNCF